MNFNTAELEMISGALHYFINKGEELNSSEDYSHYKELLKKINKDLGKED